jgi:hypothetical protein
MENTSVQCTQEDETNYTTSDTLDLQAKKKNWNFGDLEVIVLVVQYIVHIRSCSILFFSLR